MTLVTTGRFGAHLMRSWFLPVGLAVAALSACDEKSEPKPEATATAPVESAKPPTVEITPAELAAFKPLPEAMTSDENPITSAKVELGRMLYFDKRMSKNHDLSCNTCHVLSEYGVDSRETRNVSLGHKNQPGTRNSPTVYNAAGHFAQFWDARAESIEAQAQMPVLNPVEMGMPNEAYVLRVLNSIPGYVAAFKQAFPKDPSPVSFENFGKAVGAFERKLVTPSRWDKFLKGDEAALSEQEKQGFKTFMSTGCVACHSGTYLGGQGLQKVGAVKPWPNQKDQGRYEVTKQDPDKMMFKVPSLRNITKTAPYFHDGSVKRLDKAVKMMAEHQLGRKLKDKQVQSILVFLEALTGQLPKEYIKQPKLPESTAQTPKADPN